jgi:hypothetical protein
MIRLRFFIAARLSEIAVMLYYLIRRLTPELRRKQKPISSLLSPDLRETYTDTAKERPLEYAYFFNVSDMDWEPEQEEK